MEFSLQIAEIFVYNKDYDKAFDYAVQFANNNIEAINFLGRLYYNQQCKFYNPENGFKMLKRAAELGDKNAIEFIEMMNASNNDNDRNYNTTNNNYINNNRSINMDCKSKFTAIGMSGSGKTCYVLGMYHEMASGIRGFTLAPQFGKEKLYNWMDNLDEKTGIERFPKGTTKEEFNSYDFILKHDNKKILPFQWVDYAGGLLREQDETVESYRDLVNAIDESTVLYVLIDGDDLRENSQKERIKKVKKKCANYINDFIGHYAETHNEILPPIVFVISKIDLLKNIVSDNEIIEIVQESFGACFGEDTRVYIVGESLGLYISDNDYSGEVEPINIHLPLFIGIFHDFYNTCLIQRAEINNEIDQMKNNEGNIDQDIHKAKSLLEKETRKWFKKPERIEKYQKMIAELDQKKSDNKDDMQHNQNMKNQYKKLMLYVADELTRHSADFAVFEGGNKIEFSASECYEL